MEKIKQIFFPEAPLIYLNESSMPYIRKLNVLLIGYLISILVFLFGEGLLAGLLIVL